MRLLFEGDILLHYPCGGVSVCLLELMKALGTQPEIRLAAMQMTASPLQWRKTRTFLDKINPDIKMRFLPLPGRLAFALPGTGRYFQHGIDLFHAFNGIVPPWFHAGRTKLAVTFHDLVIFRHPGISAPLDDPAQAAYRRAAELADVVFTVSDFTRREAIELVGLPAEKVRVAANAAQFTCEDAMQIRNRNLPLPEKLKGRPFLLAVGIVSPRKDYETLLAAWKIFYRRHPQWHLAIVGKAGWHCGDTIRQIATTAGVVHFQEMPYEGLLNLYLHTSGYLNLSYYEGFGMPLLEAMLCSAPCCYAEGSAMDEVGCGARAIPPRNIEAAAAAMEDFACGKIPVVDAPSFSWTESAKIYAQGYRDCLK
ncbi:MAG: glycosyltransferase family 1 protein [Victivallaceae bacterium]|nr:glycosyltransferase family 1 protein [Victivallaceae bacterium]